MTDGNNATGAQAAAGNTTARSWRSRTSNRPMAVRANGNTARGRRIRDLYRAYMIQIGDPDDLLAQAAALAAAELKSAAEACRTGVLVNAGDADMADALVRIENLAARAERRLGKLAAPKRGRTLAQHLATPTAERAGA
jgi:hypothetical protein